MATNEPRPIDEVKVRTAAIMIECESRVLARRARGLCERLEELRPELQYADPVKDRVLDMLMLELSRSVIALQSLGDLAEAAKAAQKFRLPDIGGIEELARNPAIGTLTPEVAHA